MASQHTAHIAPSQHISQVTMSQVRGSPMTLDAHPGAMGQAEGPTAQLPACTLGQDTAGDCLDTPAWTPPPGWQVWGWEVPKGRAAWVRGSQ